jgi:colicin import membrane protein
MKNTVKEFLHIPPEAPEPDIFKKMVVTSAILHLALFLGFAVKAVIMPNENLNLDPAIRVDLVDLPDKIAELPEKPKENLPPAEPEVKPSKPEKTEKPEKAAKTKEPDAVVLNPNKKAREQSLDKIRKMQKEERRKKALEDIEKEVQAQEAKDRAARQAKIREALVKGNVISPGSALKGLAKSEFNEYIASIHNKVREHWNLPEWLRNDNLRTVVVVYIDYRGVVMKRNVERTSGDPRFDEYALRAVDEASPLPRPPDKFVDMVRVDGIVLGFPR